MVVSLLWLRDYCVCEWRQIPGLNGVRFWMVTILCLESSCSCSDDREGGLAPSPNRDNASRIIARTEREREMPCSSRQMAVEWVRDNVIFIDCGFRLLLSLSTAGCSVYDFPFNPLNAELNPICHLLPLLGGATIVVVSRLRVKCSIREYEHNYTHQSKKLWLLHFCFKRTGKKSYVQARDILP